MRTRGWTISITLLAAALMMTVVVPAMAAAQGIKAEVQTLDYSITIDGGSSLNFGSQDLAWSGTDAYDTDVVVRNSGALASKLTYEGTNASNGTDTWYLIEAAQGHDQFAWSLTDTAAPGTVHWVTTSPQTLKDSLAPGDSVTYHPEFTMPTSSSGQGSYSWSGFIYASAP
jgi:hypothetical protein